MKHLKAFHIFNVAAESSTFSEAADKLFITHGAISKQIKALESVLSINLFYRQGRNVKLTHEGKLLKEYTTQAFQALETGVQKLSQVQQSVLEISCEPTLTMRWLMPRMADFYEKKPETDIRISTAGGPVTLGNNGLSLAIRRDDFNVVQHYQKTPLVQEWVGPVFSPAYWKEVKNNFNKIKLIHSDTRPNAWKNWFEKSNTQGFTNNQHQTYAHFYFCFQAAVDGLGGTIGSYPLVVDDIERGNLIAPFGFVLSGNNYILLSQKNYTDNPLETAFIDWLQKQLVTCIPSQNKLNM